MVRSCRAPRDPQQNPLIRQFRMPLFSRFPYGSIPSKSLKHVRNCLPTGRRAERQLAFPARGRMPPPCSPTSTPTTPAARPTCTSTSSSPPWPRHHLRRDPRRPLRPRGARGGQDRRGRRRHRPHRPRPGDAVRPRPRRGPGRGRAGRLSRIAAPRTLLRPIDRLLLCELHPAEHAALRATLAGPGVAIHRRDGFEALLALAPPAAPRPRTGRSLLRGEVRLRGRRRLRPPPGREVAGGGGPRLVPDPPGGPPPRARRRPRAAPALIDEAAFDPPPARGMTGSGLALVNAPSGQARPSPPPAPLRPVLTLRRRSARLQSSTGRPCSAGRRLPRRRGACADSRRRCLRGLAQALQRADHSGVVGVQRVGCAQRLGLLQRGAERLGPLTAVKCPACTIVSASASACACQGSSNTRVGGARGSSGRNKIAFPEVQRDRVARVRSGPPKLGGREADRVEMVAHMVALRTLVGQGMAAVMGDDRSQRVAGIARQTGVIAACAVGSAPPGLRRRRLAHASISKLTSALRLIASVSSRVFAAAGGSGFSTWPRFTSSIVIVPLSSISMR